MASLTGPLIFIATILALTGAIQPAIGEQRYTWRVVNVDQNDPDGLNVRNNVIEAQTVRETSIVGNLSWNAHGISTSGRQVEIAGAPWMEIRKGNVEGWVKAKFLERENVTGLPEITPADMICSGTEPFWGLNMSKTPALYTGEDWATLQWSEDMRLDFMASDTIVEMGEGSWGITLKKPQEEQYLRAIIKKASPLCTDSMSNVLFPYEMVLLRGKVPRPVYGCCYVGLGN